MVAGEKDEPKKRDALLPDDQYDSTGKVASNSEGAWGRWQGGGV